MFFDGCFPSALGYGLRLGFRVEGLGWKGSVEKGCHQGSTMVL